MEALPKFWYEYIERRGSGMLGPGADEAFAPLVAASIRRRVLIAHLMVGLRRISQRYLSLPLERVLLEHWMRGQSAGRYVEALGLPRHILIDALGQEALTLHVDPRKLVRMAARAPSRVEKRPSSLVFIWDGSWDERRADLYTGSRYRLISELDENRDHLECTQRFRKLMQHIELGAPWSSHQQGVVLDTPEKIRAYLRIYIDFLDGMAAKGFDPSRGKDPLCVGISRHGRILKLNHGLHRLAMAQRIGLSTIPVEVRCVHRLWWNRVTQGATGAAALKRVLSALHECVPEDAPGSLDDQAGPLNPDDF
jgi:hypothetical protein